MAEKVPRSLPSTHYLPPHSSLSRRAPTTLAFRLLLENSRQTPASVFTLVFPLPGTLLPVSLPGISHYLISFQSLLSFSPVFVTKFCWNLDPFVCVCVTDGCFQVRTTVLPQRSHSQGPGNTYYLALCRRRLLTPGVEEKIVEREKIGCKSPGHGTDHLCG